MQLLNITFTQDEMAREVINGILWLLGLMSVFFGVIGVFVKILHDQMIDRLDKLDIDIKPIIVEVTLHTEQIKELKSEQQEQDKWLRNHDSRIQTIEKVMHQQR